MICLFQLCDMYGLTDIILFIWSQRYYVFAWASTTLYDFYGLKGIICSLLFSKTLFDSVAPIMWFVGPQRHDLIYVVLKALLDMCDIINSNGLEYIIWLVVLCELCGLEGIFFNLWYYLICDIIWSMILFYLLIISYRVIYLHAPDTLINLYGIKGIILMS